MITTVNSIDTNWPLFALSLALALTIVSGFAVLAFKYFTPDRVKHLKDLSNKLLHYLKQNKI